MNTPIPTPFDIIEPGPGALVPTWLAWLVLVIGAAAFLAAIALKRRAPRPPSVNATLRNLIDQLRRAKLDDRDQRNIEQATRLARLVISPFTRTSISTMSCYEIKSLADALQNSSDDSERSLAEALALLGELEERSYAPITSDGDLALSRAILDKLTSAIESHVGRFKPL
jgi:hypothetical protein